MTDRTPNRRQAERGSVVVLTTLAMVVLAAMATLAVDYGYLQYKRSQLQTAADASALAGAMGLLRQGDDLPSVASTAVQFGRDNLTDQDNKASAITAEDVLFSKANQGTTATTPDTVTVTVGRTGDRGNAVDMFLGGILGWNTQDLTASASASLFCSLQSKCLKPFAPPAKFTWDDTCDADKKYKNNGVLDVDSACELASVQVQGYGASDLGTQIVLKLSDSSATVVPGHFNAVDYPAVNRGTPETGAAVYRLNIAGCTGSNSNVVADGDEIQVEPGNMVGPTNQGLDELIADDPDATWDTDTSSIVGSKYANPLQSPRVALIPFYDPSQPQVSGRNSVYVYQLGAVFIESATKSGEVTGRFIRGMAVSARRDTTGTCDTASASLFGIGLVQ